MSIIKKLNKQYRISISRRRFLRFILNTINLPFLRPTKRSNLTILIYPEMLREEEFLDAFYKANFFLLPNYVKNVIIPIAFIPSFNLNNYDSFPRLEYVANVNLPPNINFHFIDKSAFRIGKTFWESDYIFIWKWEAWKQPYWISLFFNKFINVDRKNNTWEGWNWADFCYKLLISERKEAHRRLNQNKFLKYIESLKVYDKSYIFGTGPSLEDAYDIDFADGYRIVCNTIVKNELLINHINPHFIVAADAIHHFGNTNHAYRFRKDLENVILKKDIRLLIPDLFSPLLEYYHPVIYKKTISVRTDLQGVFLDLKKKLAYTNQPNILNSMLLPLGTSLSNNIYLLGFDGRAPDAELFWKNSAENSYIELKSSLVEAHPGFFEGIDYEEYADMQSISAEKIMTFGESIGNKYYCLNQTHIPALHKRQ